MVYVYRVFFIQSSIVGHLGCLHALAIVKIGPVNIGMHVSFLWPRSETARSYGSLIFNFLRNFLLFYIVAAPIYSPTNSPQKIPPFLYILANTCYLLSFWW